MSVNVVTPIKPSYAEMASRELNNWIDCAKAQYMARLRERLGHDLTSEVARCLRNVRDKQLKKGIRV